jgi:hypothetical protein
VERAVYLENLKKEDGTLYGKNRNNPVVAGRQNEQAMAHRLLISHL